VWSSQDGGQSWFPRSDQLASLAISTLIQDPIHSEILYAGSGEGFFRGRGFPGAGIFRSRNRGQSWSHLPGTGSQAFAFINRLDFNASGKVLFAATRSGIHRSLDQGESWHPSPGASQEILDLDGHPEDPRRAIAGGSAGQVLFTLDRGQTWSRARGLPEIEQENGYQRVEVCYAKADPSIVYASVDLQGGRIYRSLDGGQTFEARGTFLAPEAPSSPEPVRYLGWQGWYDNVIWAGHEDPNLVVVGGIDLWRSRNGADHLTRISRWEESPLSAHADHHMILAAPSPDQPKESVVWFGNDGGIFRVPDITQVEPLFGWSQKNTGYGVTQFYRAAVNPHTGTLIGGTQDQGNLRYSPAQGPHAWSEMIGGDGGYCAWDPAAPRTFFSEYVFLFLQRSQDDGLSIDFICGLRWNGREITWKDPPYLIPEARDQQANFIAPFLLDPAPPPGASRLVAGAASVWVSDDPGAALDFATGPHWRSLKKPIGVPRERNFVSALGMSPSLPGTLVVGHNQGEIFLSQGAFGKNPDWKEVQSSSMPRRFVTSLSLTPAGFLYATFGGYAPGNLWVSKDLGVHWCDLSRGLPEAPLRAFQVHPEHPNWIYVGGAMGFFFSADGGQTWSTTNQGPTGSSVEQLLWMPTRLGPSGEAGISLVAVTHGRGLFALEMEPPDKSRSPLRNYPSILSRTRRISERSLGTPTGALESSYPPLR
jgi:photosystem II stability/assembly factor-like uncharacterized protein